MTIGLLSFLYESGKGQVRGLRKHHCTLLLPPLYPIPCLPELAVGIQAVLQGCLSSVSSFTESYNQTLSNKSRGFIFSSRRRN